MDGKLIATRTANLSRRDLREVMDEQTLKQAETVALSGWPARSATAGPADESSRVERTGAWTCGAFSAPASPVGVSRWTCSAAPARRALCGSWHYVMSAGR